MTGSAAPVACSARSAPSAYSSIPPVESMCTPSASTSPAATYSITEVTQPHSGWIRNSEPGLRVAHRA